MKARDALVSNSSVTKLARANVVLSHVLNRAPTDAEVGRLLEETPEAVQAARKAWVSSFLRKAREEQGKSLRALAEQIGMSASGLSRVELGQRGPSKEIADRLERALGLEPGSLIRRVEIAEAGLTERGVPAQLVEVSSELIRELAADPRKMHSLPPRKFEELVAELMRDMGCEVQLTPESKDGGRDVLATIATPFGKFLAIVECKRYAEHRKVGAAIVERFLFTVDRKDRASLGIIATTSSFTSDARLLETQNQWRLGLRDYKHLIEWLGHYGKWTAGARSELWKPQTPLISLPSET